MRGWGETAGKILRTALHREKPLGWPGSQGSLRQTYAAPKHQAAESDAGWIRPAYKIWKHNMLKEIKEGVECASEGQKVRK